MSKIISALIFILLACSCNKTGPAASTGPVTLKLTGSGMDITKADLNESLARTVQFFICSNGEILHSRYFSESADMVMDVEYSSEQEYTIFTLVNLPEITGSKGRGFGEVMAEASASGMFPYAGHCSGALIMTGAATRKIEGNCTVEIPVHRLIDKIHITGIRNLSGQNLSLKRIFIPDCPEYMRWNGESFFSDPASMLNTAGKSAEEWILSYRNAFDNYLAGNPAEDYWSGEFTDCPGMLSENIDAEGVGYGENRFIGKSLYPLPTSDSDGHHNCRMVLEVTDSKGLPGWYCIELSFPAMWNCEILIQELTLKSSPASEPFGKTYYIIHDTACDIGNWEKHKEVKITI